MGKSLALLPVWATQHYKRSLFFYVVTDFFFVFTSQTAFDSAFVALNQGFVCEHVLYILLWSLELPPTSILILKTVPHVIDLFWTQSVKKLDCIDQLSASTSQKPQTHNMFSFNQKVHVYFYNEVLTQTAFVP